MTDNLLKGAVKALEWDRRGNALTEFGSYNFRHRQPGVIALFDTAGEETLHETEELAKDAAQKDYNVRGLSALTPEAVAVLRSAQADEAREAAEDALMEKYADDPIAAAIAVAWGERCDPMAETGPDLADCPICAAWRAYDALRPAPDPEVVAPLEWDWIEGAGFYAKRADFVVRESEGGWSYHYKDWPDRENASIHDDAAGAMAEAQALHASEVLSNLTPALWRLLNA